MTDKNPELHELDKMLGLGVLCTVQVLLDTVICILNWRRQEALDRAPWVSDDCLFQVPRLHTQCPLMNPSQKCVTRHHAWNATMCGGTLSSAGPSAHALGCDFLLLLRIRAQLVVVFCRTVLLAPDNLMTTASSEDTIFVVHIWISWSLHNRAKNINIHHQDEVTHAQESRRPRSHT